MSAVDYAPSHRLVPRRRPDRSEPNLLDLIAPDDTIDGLFARFDHDHPEVMVEFVALAREAKAAGARIGAKGIWERLRWSIEVAGLSGTGVKLNNVLTSRYARAAMERHADLAGFFTTRELRAR